ncbi:MAG TPA: RNA polymerase sigma factor [Bacteroidia bacterium]|nr:RNA polymerase sigma factor [Bacteroidia bacterium]
MNTVAENLTALSDVQLIEQIQQGNNRAFDVLMVRHSPHLKIFLQKKFPGDIEWAKDALQTTWLSVLEELRKGHYHESGEFKKWLVKLAHNTACNIKRTEEHYVHGEKANTEEPYASPAEGMDDVQKKILTIIAHMQPVMKRVVLLYSLRELSCREIAEKLHLEVNTVTKTLSRAYIHIRKKAGIMKRKNNFQLGAVKKGRSVII